MSFANVSRKQWTLRGALYEAFHPAPVREIVICGDVAIVPLTQEKVANIDAADIALVAGKNWYVSNRYAVWGGMLMHRVILDAPPGKHVDHIDGDGLNNRRSNLRLCTHAQNMQNSHRKTGTSGYRGVYWHKAAGKWNALISIDGRSTSLGYFADPTDAARAYDAAAIAHHGEFAKLNFPAAAGTQAEGGTP